MMMWNLIEVITNQIGIDTIYVVVRWSWLRFTFERFGNESGGLGETKKGGGERGGGEITTTSM